MGVHVLLWPLCVCARRGDDELAAVEIGMGCAEPEYQFVLLVLILLGLRLRFPFTPLEVLNGSLRLHGRTLVGQVVVRFSDPCRARCKRPAAASGEPRGRLRDGGGVVGRNAGGAIDA